MVRVIVLIPAYNEEKFIGEVIRKAREFVDLILVVDDGSKDKTKEIAEYMGAIVLKHENNLGKGDAIKTGLNYIKKNYTSNIIVLMDADCQHDPNDIPKLIKPIVDNDYEVVFGSRMHDTKKMSIQRKLSNHITTKLINFVTGMNLKDTQCGFRALKSEVLNKIDLKTSGFIIESEFIIEAYKRGCKITEVPINVIYGEEKSKISPIKDTLRFIKFILKVIMLYKKT